MLKEKVVCMRFKTKDIADVQRRQHFYEGNELKGSIYLTKFIILISLIFNNLTLALIMTTSDITFVLS